MKESEIIVENKIEVVKSQRSADKLERFKENENVKFVEKKSTIRQTKSKSIQDFDTNFMSNYGVIKDPIKENKESLEQGIMKLEGEIEDRDIILIRYALSNHFLFRDKIDNILYNFYLNIGTKLSKN